MEDIVLEAKNIKKHFGGVVALDDGNLICRRGKITGLLGANGSGKSTMAKIIAGVYKPDAGEIRYMNRKIEFKNPDEARTNGIGLVYQNLSLVSDLTVWQNVCLGREKKKKIFLNDEYAKSVSKEIIEKIKPNFDINRKVFELSPGEMQIVEVAKAVYTDPKLLILDEPTAALEQTEVQNLFNFIHDIVKKGVAIVFTSHRIWEVMEICDDVVIFRNGKNVYYSDFERDEKDPEKIIFYISGEKKENNDFIKRKEKEKPKETVLSVKSLNYIGILRDINFELKKGEILGIGGLAGQGQHELMLALAGNYKDIECDIELAGEKINLNHPVIAIRNGIVLVPGDRQTEGLFMNHSVFNNLVIPKLSLKNQPLFIPEKRYRKEFHNIIDVLSIKVPNLDVPASNLSGGNQQKVVVGKWLSLDIKVLLLDDAAKGIDVGAKKDLYHYIVEQVRKGKMNVIMYASDNKELIEYCDRVLIMYEGKIIAELKDEDINENTIVSTSMRFNN